MARPRKEIKQEVFENLCAIQCTKEEICAVLGVSDKTLDAWIKRTYHSHFSVVFREKRARGKASLRRTQWKMAEKNVAMSIFLGKQYLGQSDNPQEDEREELLTRLDNIAQVLKDASKAE